MVIFHSYVNVYQRVLFFWICGSKKYIQHHPTIDISSPPELDHLGNPPRKITPGWMVHWFNAVVHHHFPPVKRATKRGIQHFETPLVSWEEMVWWIHTWVRNWFYKHCYLQSYWRRNLHNVLLEPGLHGKRSLPNPQFCRLNPHFG
jgi:hypothetical protein